MTFLSDSILVDEISVAMENDTNETQCNESALGHSSNPYIPAWYLQVFCISLTF